jgi:cytoskeletal protein CcmA (bactofilin family)
LDIDIVPTGGFNWPVLKQIINQEPAGAKGAKQAAAPPAPQAPAPAAAAAPAQPVAPSQAPMMSASKNILSNDVEIIGNLKFSHDLIIDGKIEGEVNSDGNLTVGENATVRGEIKTKSVTVFGKVEGNITVTDRCELKSQAQLIGDIRAGTLSIEEGATFMGASTVGAGAKAPAAKPQQGGAKPAAAAPANAGKPQQAQG